MFSNKLVENNFLSIDKYLLDTASCDDGDKTIMYRELVLTGKKCGCAIYVHLQLDLLKFYLAILNFCSRVVLKARSVC